MALEGTTSTAQTTGVGGLAGLATGGSNASLNNVNFDTFLKLLVTQLKNQDPLNPMEGTEFTSQIAQFSQLEQTIKSNTQLEKLAQAREYSQQALAVATIGKEVLVPGKVIQLTATGADFGYKLDGPAQRVDIEVVDSTGKVVRTINGDGAEGTHLISWDGKNTKGEQLDPGTYAVRVSAQDIDGKVVGAFPYSFGVVSEVTNDGLGELSVVLTDGRGEKFDDVLSIRAKQGS